jgi:hypothetical protein
MSKKKKGNKKELLEIIKLLLEILLALVILIKELFRNK